MAITLNPTNSNRVVERTATLNKIPNQWSLTTDLGLFADKYVSQKTVKVDMTKYSDRILSHRNWDERNNTIGKDTRQSLLLEIPHTPLDDAIYPQDIDGVVQTTNEVDLLNLSSVAEVRMEKMERMRRAHALTMEASRMHLITTGEVLDPRGVTRQNYGALNFYTEFGITQKSVALNLDAADNPTEKIEEAYQYVQEAAGNGSIYNSQVALVSSEMFNAIKGNAYVQDGMKTIINPRSLGMIIDRPTGGKGLDQRYRTVEFGGITWIDAGRASYELPDGTRKRYIEADEGFLMPFGFEDLYHTYYAPANKFGSVNTKAQGSYWFEYFNDRKDIIEIMTEQNFLNVCLYPQAVVKLTKA